MTRPPGTFGGRAWRVARLEVAVDDGPGQISYLPPGAVVEFVASQTPDSPESRRAVSAARAEGRRAREQLGLGPFAPVPPNPGERR